MFWGRLWTHILGELISEQFLFESCDSVFATITRYVYR